MTPMKEKDSLMKKHIFLNTIYDQEPDKALKEYKDSELDLTYSYLYLKRDMLKELTLWSVDIRNSIAQYNTNLHYTQVRKLSISDDILNFSFLYVILKNKIQVSKKELLLLDPLVVFDICISLGINVYDLDDITVKNLLKILNKDRTITREFFKYLNTIDKNILIYFLEKNYEVFGFLLNTDPELSKKILYSKECKDEYKYMYFLSIPYNNWYKHLDLLNDSFYKKYYTMFLLKDLFKVKKHDFIWNCIKKDTYQSRYKLYFSLTINNDVVDDVRRDLKTLVKSNIPQKIIKFNMYSVKDPLSVISEIIDQVTVFPALIPLLTQVVTNMDDLSLDIYMFYIIKYILIKRTFISEGVFSKWYVNIVKFIKELLPFVSRDSYYDMILEYLSCNKYSCVLLIECIDKVPEFILNRIKDAYNNVFVYEKYDFKLKTEVSDIYSRLTSRKITFHCNILDLRYNTLYEIDYFCKSEGLIPNLVKIIIEAKKFDTDDYYFVRNLAKLVDHCISHLNQELNWLSLYFSKFSRHKEEDLRVLCSSIVSKIEIAKRKLVNRNLPNNNHKRAKYDLKEELSDFEPGMIINNNARNVVDTFSGDSRNSLYPKSSHSNDKSSYSRDNRDYY